MNRAWWKFGIGLLWLGLPLIAFRFWMVWDRLPANMATHFNAVNQPNGWMTREGSMYFILGLYLFLAVLFTAIMTVVYKVHAPDVAAWAILGLFYVILGVLYYGNESVLAYNLTGAPVHLFPIVAPVFAAIFVVIIITFTNKRGQSLPTGSVLAEEVHAGRPFALVLFLPVVIELAVIYAIPNTGLRITFALVALILLAAGAMAWSGFTYVFTSNGVEIRTLGFRLRSIPAKQIKEYASGRWNIIGGYGVRGIGERRAYVWSNRGVRIKTDDGEVFLGHNNPDQIIHDLDAVKQFVH
jgi:Domain of unknown function (DUF1648)